MRLFWGILTLMFMLLSINFNEIMFRVNDATNGVIWKYITPKKTQTVILSTPSIEIGESKIYEHADIVAAIDVVIEQAQYWNASRLYYDENALIKSVGYIPTNENEIIILMDFTTSDNSIGFDSNTFYTQFQWHLRKNTNDTWEIFTSGY